EAQAAELLVGPAACRILVHRGQQRPQPVGRLARGLEGAAPPAGPVPGLERVPRAVEEGEVLPPRGARGASGPAEDPGRADAGPEDAVEAPVAGEEGRGHDLLGGG